jgi:hypothetical protein
MTKIREHESEISKKEAINNYKIKTYTSKIQGVKGIDKKEKIHHYFKPSTESSRA